MADVNLWVPVITGLAGISGAVGSQYVSHIYARQREKDVASRKRHDELVFITTELVFLLEQFAEGCARLADDDGEVNREGITEVTTSPPELDMSQVAGDWRVLPVTLMYRIRELPLLLNEAEKHVASAYENDSAPDYSFTFLERKYQYACLGLKAILQARRLRKLACLPGTRLDATKWSAQPVLWRVWRVERKRRAQEHILRQRDIAAYQLKMQHHYESRRNGPLDSGEIQ